MRATFNLWLMYYFSTKMYSKSSHCHPVSSSCSEAYPLPHLSQSLASKKQATGMEPCPTWGWLLTKPDYHFGAIVVPLATNMSSSWFCNESCVHQSGKIQSNWMANADTCPMSGKHPLSRGVSRICFKKCLNAFLNRNGLKHKRVSII